MEILIIGAGKSSTHLIDYLASIADKYNFILRVADTNQSNLTLRCSEKNCNPILLQSGSIDELTAYISNAYLVISMLPPSLHSSVAKICLNAKAHLVTPSYISDEMQQLDDSAKDAGLIFLNEMGLDPGIDHMCCMKIIDEEKTNGAKILSLRSHCGALVAPQSDTNLWHYKISWNPRNVVLAGAGTDFIKYRENEENVLLKYEELFAHTSTIKVGEAVFESYPNRDSLKYEKRYGIEGIPTLYRGTLRVPPYCKAWNKLVNYGATSTQKSFPKIEKQDLENDPETNAMFEELGIFDLHKNKGLACDVLQKVIEEKWLMMEKDIDRVVMIHEIETEKNNQKKLIQSSLIIDGENHIHTALSKTVGLPIAFATELIIQKQINSRGVLMPVCAEFYIPILEQLKNYGVAFTDKTIS